MYPKFSKPKLSKKCDTFLVRMCLLLKDSPCTVHIIYFYIYFNIYKSEAI